MVLGGWDVSYERGTPVLPLVVVVEVIVIVVEALRILAKFIGVSVKQVFAPPWDPTVGLCLGS